ncbi:MAG: type II toxin-antitoxin system RelE/ParE family toxin [Bacteroidia bacterium]|nr:MAG: type II toxin-antitoxin system RelE/ParE family toxin [Bacteroidia bacterium]
MMKVVWSQFAQDALDAIYVYYFDQAGERFARNLVEVIVKYPEYLASNPKAGQLEEYLQNREIEYRYIVFKNYKIIYSIDPDLKMIKIADIFDTRQNPVKIIRKK